MILRKFVGGYQRSEGKVFVSVFKVEVMCNLKMEAANRLNIKRRGSNCRLPRRWKQQVQQKC
jgi:hypothetical protein